MPFPGQLLSVLGISIITSVDEGGGSGVVHISVGVSGSCRYVSRISSSGRVGVVGVVGIVKAYIILAIRTVSLPVLLSIMGIGRITCVDEGGGSGMVNISVSMGGSCRYIPRISRSGRVGVVGIVRAYIILAIRAISLPVLLSKMGIGRITCVDEGGGSGMVHISVGVGGSCRYITRISISRRTIIIVWVVVTVPFPGQLLSVLGISIIASVDEGGSSGMVHISVAMGRNCRCVGRVTISGRVVVGIGKSCVAGVVRIGMGVDGCIAMRGGIMMSASDHGRTCRPTHMNLVMVSTPFIPAVSVVSISMTVVAISITVVAVTVVGCISVISSITAICTSVPTVPSIAAIASISSIAAITAIAITVSVPVVGSLNY